MSTQPVQPSAPRAAAFLTAKWRHLAMLNYETDPASLAPLVPPGTELDAWQGRTFVSVVGFMFLDTRVCGIPIPFHRNFEEVNLRFYVRRKSEEGSRRGVVFIKELVPRAAIAFVARVVYGENYRALPMSHRIDCEDQAGERPRSVAYAWKFKGAENRIELSVAGEARSAAAGSEEEFITEHYWGYTRRRGGGALEYRVEHPPWRIWPAASAILTCDAAGLYGPAFAEVLARRPASAFLADGSAVTVYRGVPLVL